MPIVNGHPAECGCYVEGHRGWYAGQRAIEVAQGFGFELDAEGQDAVDRYYTPDNDDLDLMEVVSGRGGIVDEATDWLNDHTRPDNFTWGEVEGTWFDLQGNPVPDDQVIRYVWHWRDGEFFLSPLCENGDCDDDTCAHWD